MAEKPWLDLTTNDLSPARQAKVATIASFGTATQQQLLRERLLIEEWRDRNPRPKAEIDSTVRRLFVEAPPVTYYDADDAAAVERRWDEFYREEATIYDLREPYRHYGALHPDNAWWKRWRTRLHSLFERGPEGIIRYERMWLWGTRVVFGRAVPWPKRVTRLVGYDPAPWWRRGTAHVIQDEWGAWHEWTR